MRPFVRSYVLISTLTSSPTPSRIRNFRILPAIVEMTSWSFSSRTRNFVPGSASSQSEERRSHHGHPQARQGNERRRALREAQGGHRGDAPAHWKRRGAQELRGARAGQGAVG